MQDVRIRIGAAAVLSFSAFVSLWGAAAAFFWFFIFTPRLESIRRLRFVIGVFVMIGIISLLLQTMNGSGFSYGIRISVIVLIGIWLAGEYHPGEFLHFGVWLAGDHLGFDVGLMAEMGMQSLISLLDDLDRIRIAYILKKIPMGITNIIPAGTLLIRMELIRARDNAELLAVRGYRHGGVLHPEFKTSRLDIAAGLSVIPVFFIAALQFVNFLYFDSAFLKGLL
jgi:hypothetical protein